MKKIGIVIGIILLAAGLFVVWSSTQIMEYKKDYYVSNTLEVPPRGYASQVITFYSDWGTRFCFTLSQGDIKYALLEADKFDQYTKGQFSPQWVKTSSDFFYWSYGISGVMNLNGVEVPTPSMYYLFYNEDSQSKTVYFQSEKYTYEKTTNYFYMAGGFWLLSVGVGVIAVILGLLKKMKAPKSK